VNAIQAADTYTPEVVLIDIAPLGIDGFEVCRRLRKRMRGSEMIIIALTESGEQTDRRRLPDAGFDSQLVRPVDYAALAAVLDTSTGARTER
jgi:DNA-binding response OmpR family regulator